MDIRFISVHFVSFSFRFQYLVTILPKGASPCNLTVICMIYSIHTGHISFSFSFRSISILAIDSFLFRFVSFHYIILAAHKHVYPANMFYLKF